MSRWEPNAYGRLQQAAIELFSERGYEQTTVAMIADRAGLTERTFFRHFADKREVLFGPGNQLQELMVDAVTSAPVSWPPFDALAASLTVGAEMLQGRRNFSRQRQAIIDANPVLQERELIKLAALATALGEAVEARGVDEARASLAGEVAVAVFRAAFERWHREGTRAKLPQLMRDSLKQTRALFNEPGKAGPKGRRTALSDEATTRTATKTP